MYKVFRSKSGMSVVLNSVFIEICRIEFISISMMDGGIKIFRVFDVVIILYVILVW